MQLREVLLMFYIQDRIWLGAVTHKNEIPIKRGLIIIREQPEQQH